MPDEVFQVNNPHQLSLTGDDVLEITLRIGVIRGVDHAQFQFEVHDGRTGELISLRARHHVPLSAAAEELDRWCQALRTELWDATGPF